MKVYHKEKILIVEDNYMSFKLLEAHFRRSNLEIIHAVNGLKALEFFEKDPEIKLILMDIQLPGISGLEVTKKIRETNAELPIIAATANVFDEEKTACFEAGCNHYLTKPINFIALFELLDKYLN